VLSFFDQGGTSQFLRVEFRATVYSD
jgi:hypothetical protein